MKQLYINRGFPFLIYKRTRVSYAAHTRNSHWINESKDGYETRLGNHSISIKLVSVVSRADNDGWQTNIHDKAGQNVIRKMTKATEILGDRETTHSWAAR